MDNFPFDLRKFNTSNIYSYFLDHEHATKQDLATTLNLTLPTINKNIDYLTELGLISKSGKRRQTGGRSAVTYSICADAKGSLGIDITKHHVSCVAVGLNGTILAFKRNRLLFEYSDPYFNEVWKLLKKFIDENHFEDERILGVGIGIPALVQADNKTVFYSRIMGFEEKSYDMFKKYIPYDIAMFNDAKASCFAEKWVNKDIQNTFYIMLSTNVGGAMIINGQVYSGDNFRSAEIGHVVLVPNGRQCYCGQNGCADPYLAVANLSSDDLAGYFETLKTTTDEKILDNWNQYMDYIAAAVMNVRAILDCDVILGGYVGAYLEPYIGEIRKKALKISTFDNNADFIKLCTYKNESIAAGAALHYISEFVKTI
ncbi:MAG: ROK family transcriptional regulator [Lachnospiraceae bacterium]|nr:ROK family transcriptional regulator [Lachnospiraceae bacterium]